MQLLSAFVLTTQDYHHHHYDDDEYDYHHHHYHHNVGPHRLLLPVACVCDDVWKTLG